MVIFLIVLLIIFIVIDLLFYIPITIHIYAYKDRFGIYVFSIPIIYISNEKTINLLKKKISLQKLKNVDSLDIKYIESVSIDKIQINDIFVDRMDYNSIFLRIILSNIENYLNNLFNIDCLIETNPSKHYYFYLKMNVKIARVLKYHFIVRRLKNERKSHQRNLKNINN